MKQFSGGHANLTYSLSAADGREWVVRRPPVGPIAKNAHDMSREHRVLSGLCTAYDRALKAYHLCENETIIGEPFLVAERRWGVVVKQIWPQCFKGLTNFEIRTANATVDALADLHPARPQEIGLSGLGRPKGFAARQAEG